MPMGPYFMYTGGSPLVLLFAANAYLPAPKAAPFSASETSEMLHIRIRSENKWPEKVVFVSPPPDNVADHSRHHHAAKHATTPLGQWSRQLAEE
jgi:hypothetical protein